MQAEQAATDAKQTLINLRQGNADKCGAKSQGNWPPTHLFVMQA